MNKMKKPTLVGFFVALSEREKGFEPSTSTLATGRSGRLEWKRRDTTGRLLGLRPREPLGSTPGWPLKMAVPSGGWCWIPRGIGGFC
jgi:hypothetical protein